MQQVSTSRWLGLIRVGMAEHQSAGEYGCGGCVYGSVSAKSLSPLKNDYTPTLRIFFQTNKQFYIRDMESGFFKGAGLKPCETLR